MDTNNHIQEPIKVFGITTRDSKRLVKENPKLNNKGMEAVHQMQRNYVKGKLTIFYGCDIVSLVHKVNGRVSSMDLTEWDEIEVNIGDKWQKVTLEEILESEVIDTKKYNSGRSVYHDSKIRVRLDSKGSKYINSLEKRWEINEVITLLKHGQISDLEASQRLVDIDFHFDE